MPFQFHPGENLIVKLALLDMPDGANFLGAWSGATAYVVDDVVIEAEIAYICILGHTNHVPPNGTYWTPLSAIAATNVLNFKFEILPGGISYFYDGVILPPNMLLVDGLITIEVLAKDTVGLAVGTYEVKTTSTIADADYFASAGQTDVVCEEDVIEVTPC
jgi:hypothetical protein